MSDKDAPGSGAEQNTDPSSTPAGRAEEGDRSDSWFERLRVAVGFKPTQSSRRELEDAIAATEENPFSPEERTMLTNILGLRDIRVEDIMIPRADVEAIDIETSVGELMQTFETCGHSRMPVYRESLDDPVGMVHIKDLLGYVARAGRVKPARDGEPMPVSDLRKVDLTRPIGEAGLLRTVLFVPPSMPVATLLKNMQGSRVQMALVIDEYGGTDGLVSIEDAVEAIVGDIEDEHDEEEPEIVMQSPGVFIADASADLDEVAAKVGGGLGATAPDEEFETIGGMVFSLLGRIPAAGETMTTPSGHVIEILDADPRRIRRLKITTPAMAAAAEESVVAEERLRAAGA